MEGTKLPLWKWLFALHLFYGSTNGVSAKYLERMLEISYRHAWSMANKIRSEMDETCIRKLKGVIEVDETYIGGKKKDGKHAFVNKRTVFGMIERNGNVITFAVENRNKETILPIIKQHVHDGSVVYSDEHGVYISLKDEGYIHDSIPHKDYKWANGDVCTNAIEGHWSRVKNSIRGTYIHISKQWLQSYLNEFSYKHNRRNNKRAIFWDLLDKIIDSSTARSIED